MSASTIVKAEAFIRLFEQAVDGSAPVDEFPVVFETFTSQDPDNA